jgi:hypothetical protein
LRMQLAIEQEDPALHVVQRRVEHLKLVSCGIKLPREFVFLCQPGRCRFQLRGG